MEISQKLKSWRKARKLTQRGAAVELQVPLETLRRWEQGKNEPVGLARIALLSVIDKKKKTQ
jgi:DNA-binding transcriptional regulator YiaG